MTSPTPASRIPTSVDVAIVGSGPTGAAYARILSERRPDLTLACFELGPQLSEVPGLHVKNIVDENARRLAQRASEGLHPHSVDDGSYVDPARRVVRPGTHLLPSGYQQEGEDGIPALAMSTNVGGMGAHWTAACPRPGESEWVDARPDLADLLTEAERLLGVSSAPFIAAPFAEQVRQRLAAEFDAGLPDDRKVSAMPLAVQRRNGVLHWSGSDVVFGDETRSNRRFSLVPETQVTRVLTADGAVRGVTVMNRRLGATADIAARVVVVAADALRTPQLLFASGIRPWALGRYLNDQPQVVFAARLEDIDLDAVEDVAGDSTGIVEQSGVAWVPYTDSEPFHGQVMQLDASPIPLSDEDEPHPGSIVGLGWFCAKDLREEDRIVFSDHEVDDFGMPRPTVHYRLTETDLANLEAARRAVVRAADAVGARIGDAPITLAGGASLHYQGTTRMGTHDDGKSVCGPTSEVWSVSGLYVAGNNVIPTSMACNPTLTSVALAIGGASDIAQRLPPSDREDR
jgi:choline dehydrogenase-like flavoprotein